MSKYIEKECKTHGITSFVLEGRGYYRCRQCRMDAVVRRRVTVKQKLVEYFGGKCQACGYDRYAGAMDFHHENDGNKDFGLAERGSTISFERLKEEARKCVLLCATCHREVHAGLRECPERLFPD